jgi:hypothetical protein
MSAVLVATLSVLGVIAFVSLLVVLAKRAAAQRRAALESVALRAGWSFSGDAVDPASLGSALFPLFTHGRARKARNVMRLSGSVPAVTAFDYEYTVGSGKHQSTVVQTVVHVSSARFSVPPFVLGPENLLHKVGGMLGYHDIDFDSSPEFSRTYLLRSKEAEAQVRDVFSPSVRAYFEQRAPLTVEGFDDGMLVYRTGRRAKPEDVLTFIEDAQTVARQFEG